MATRAVTVAEDDVRSRVDGNAVVLVVHSRVLDGNSSGAANIETVRVLAEVVTIGGIARARD